MQPEADCQKTTSVARVNALVAADGAIKLSSTASDSVGIRTASFADNFRLFIITLPPWTPNETEVYKSPPSMATNAHDNKLAK